MKLQDGKYYWVLFANEYGWEIVKYKSDDNKLHFTNGCTACPSSCIDIDPTPIIRNVSESTDEKSVQITTVTDF